MEKNSIRRQVSEIFGILIDKGGWDNIFERLDKERRLNITNLWKILLLILKRLEEKEENER